MELAIDHKLDPTRALLGPDEVRERQGQVARHDAEADDVVALDDVVRRGEARRRDAQRLRLEPRLELAHDFLLVHDDERVVLELPRGEVAAEGNRPAVPHTGHVEKDPVRLGVPDQAPLLVAVVARALACAQINTWNRVATI